MRRPKHDTRFGSFVVSIGARVLRRVFRFLAWTYRVEVVSGREHLVELLREPRPVLLSFWHNRTFLGAHFIINELHRRGLEITLLASQSRDGELVTRTFERWGIHTVRGSASRGGREAMRSLYRAISKHGRSPIMIPDGPRGPVYHFKVGVAVLAQMSKAPILPMGFAVKRSWRIKSWDRIFVPWPFSRIQLVVGEPQTVPRGLSSEELEAERQRLEELLDRLTLEAEKAAGSVDALRLESR